MDCLSSDGSLLMLPELPPFEVAWLEELSQLTFPEISTLVAKKLLGQYLSDSVLEQVCAEAFDFMVPLIPLSPEMFVMELTHGPTASYKDFGAQFLAKVLPHLVALDEQKPLHLVLATAGDTGAALALAMAPVKGVKLSLVFPNRGVSAVQKAQMTTWAAKGFHHVQAIEVNGAIDDCQRLVKELIKDRSYCQAHRITSFNSLNLLHWLPQCFCYAWAWSHMKKLGQPIVISVPSGHLSNVSAGLLMKRLGLPIHAFVAANNVNHPYGDYVLTGIRSVSPVRPTLSSTLDIAVPNNLERILYLYGQNRMALARDLFPSWCSDDFTQFQMKNIHKLTGYVMEPHTAIGFQGLESYTAHHHYPFTGLVVGTVHPAKHLSTLPGELAKDVAIPASLQGITELPQDFVKTEVDVYALRDLITT